MLAFIICRHVKYIIKQAHTRQEYVINAKRSKTQVCVVYRNVCIILCVCQIGACLCRQRREVCVRKTVHLETKRDMDFDRSALVCADVAVHNWG